MRIVKVDLTYFQLVMLARTQARELADNENLSHADLLTSISRIVSLKEKLVEAWGNGLGNG